MKTRIEESADNPWNGVWALTGLLAGALLIGALVAPLVFNLLQMLGRQVAAWSGLRELDYARVGYRSVMLAAVLGLLPALRLAGISRLADIGFTRVANGWRALGGGALLGAGSLAAMWSVGWALGAYTASAVTAGQVLTRLFEYGLSGLLVGVIEEGLFRGALFGVCRRAMGFPIAAALTSAFFSALHFARPAVPEGLDCSAWYSGFALIPHMFGTVETVSAILPFALTLFLMGLVLCAFYDAQRSLYFIIGLHGGWVLSIRLGVFCFDRQVEILPALFGRELNISRSWAATLVIALFLVAALVWRQRRGRAWLKDAAAGEGGA